VRSRSSDKQLRSRFDWLREPDPDAAATPPVLVAFDILYRDGTDLTPRPLRERRRLLEELLVDSAMALPARRLAPDGLEAWAQAAGARI